MWTMKKELLVWAFVLYGVLTLIAMAPMNIGAAILALAILMTSRKEDFKLESTLKKSKSYFWISAFLALMCAVSLAYASIRPLGFGGRFVEVHFWKDFAKAWYLFWPLVIVVGLRKLSKPQKEFVLKSWIFAFTFLSVLGILQYFTGWPRDQSIPGEDHHYHVTLFLGHHLSVASIFIFPFFASLDFVRSSKGKQKFFYLFACGVGALALLLTYSRTLWVALPIGLIFWILFSLPRKTSAFLLTLVFIAGVLLFQYPPVYNRIHNGMGIEDRINLWKANLEFFQLRPITGVGWRHTLELSGYYYMDKLHTSDVFSGHAHNNLIEMLGGTGLLGGFAWVIWTLFVFKLFLKNKVSLNKVILGYGLACAWIVFQINGLTQVNIWEAKVQHQVAWVIAWVLL